MGGGGGGLPGFEPGTAVQVAAMYFVLTMT